MSAEIEEGTAASEYKLYATFWTDNYERYLFECMWPEEAGLLAQIDIEFYGVT